MQTMVYIGAILVIIGAIAAWINISQETDGGSGFLAFVIIVVVGFVLLGTTGMIAEGVEYLEIIAHEVRKDNSETVTMETEKKANYESVKVSNSRATLGNTTDKWRCSQCEEMNSAKNIFCKYCGSHR